MSDSPNYRAIFVILDDIEKQGLIQFNIKYYDEGYFKNFLNFQKSFSNSTTEILSNLDTFQTHYDEMVIFTIYSQISYINSHLDLINTFLKIIVNPAMLKGGFDENTMLNIMIKKICNKMQYPEKLKNSIKRLFLEDFRNAISKQKFRIYNNGNLEIYPNEQELKRNLTIKDLIDYSLQVMTILEAMLDWSDGDSHPKKKKTYNFDIIVNELIDQVKIMDKKLDRLS